MTKQRQEIRAALTQAAKPRPRDKFGEALATGIDALTSGWGSEIVGALDEKKGREFKEDRARFAKENPVLNGGAMIGGAIIPYGFAAKALRGAKPIATATGIGAAQGAGADGDAMQKTAGALVGGTMGGALGVTSKMAFEPPEVTKRKVQFYRDLFDAIAKARNPQNATQSAGRLPKPELPRTPYGGKPVADPKIPAGRGTPQNPMQQNAAPKMGGKMIRDTGTNPTGPMSGAVKGGEPAAARPGMDVWERYAGKNAGGGAARPAPYMPPASPKPNAADSGERLKQLRKWREGMRQNAKKKAKLKRQQEAQTRFIERAGYGVGAAGAGAGIAMGARGEQLRNR